MSLFSLEIEVSREGIQGAKLSALGRGPCGSDSQWIEAVLFRKRGGRGRETAGEDTEQEWI